MEIQGDKVIVKKYCNKKIYNFRGVSVNFFRNATSNIVANMLVLKNYKKVIREEKRTVKIDLSLKNIQFIVFYTRFKKISCVKTNEYMLILECQKKSPIGKG